ncbi:TPA: hypothetical protein DCX15_00955 [bacterium]|nr:hypothetical protein [bacterium]
MDIIGIRDWLDGKKTYLLCISGAITSMVAYASGELNEWQLIMAILLALEQMAQRAGTAKAERASRAKGK